MGDIVVDGGAYSTEVLRDRAFRFLEQGESENDTRPWLMYLSTPAAHIPFLAEPRFADAPVSRWNGNESVFEEDLSDKPRHVRKPHKGKCDLECGRRIREQQHRTLMSVDIMVDEVMKKLEELGQADNTLALFVSDNGSMWGEHGLGNKRFPYRPSVNVPFGMRWPARINPGIDRRIVSLVDIAPTVLDAAKIDGGTDTEMDGRSLLDKWRRKEMLLEHWHSKTVPAYGSLWSNDYQYVEYYNRNLNRVISREYFDLTKDPWQLENLLAPGSDSRPSRRELSDLSERLARFRVCEGSDCP
jgi:arylsulfatase A-like enzyme